MRFLPNKSLLAVGLVSCLVPCSGFAQTKSDDEGSKSTNPTPQANQVVPPNPLPPPQTERTPDQASMELSFEPAFFVGGNAPPRPGFFALFRLAAPLVGFDIGALTNVGLPGNTVEPLNHNGAGLPASSSQTAAFVFGANFIHYSIELYQQGPSHLYLLLPEPDLRLIFSFANVPSSSGTSGGIVLAPGGSLLGLRFTRYIGGNWSWISELRGPTGFLYLPVMYGGDTSNPYASIGFSIATGLAL